MKENAWYTKLEQLITDGDSSYPVCFFLHLEPGNSICFIKETLRLIIQNLHSFDLIWTLDTSCSCVRWINMPYFYIIKEKKLMGTVLLIHNFILIFLNIHPILRSVRSSKKKSILLYFYIFSRIFITSVNCNSIY